MTAFAEGGLIFSSICLMLVFFQSYTTSVFLLETCARAEALQNAPLHGNRLPRHYSMAIRNRIFELPELTETFLGRRWSRFFSVLTSLDLYGITWTFAAVFGLNLAENIPIMDNVDTDYKIYICIFLAVVLPLSCVSLLDQLWIQMAFLAARIVMVCMMIVSLIIAYAQPDEMHFEVLPDGPVLQGTKGIPTFAGVVLVLQTCVFSTAFQFSIPGLAGISSRRKEVTKNIRAAVVFSLSTNLVVAILTAYYFGSDFIESSNNLNWLTYVGAPGTKSAGAKIVSNYIVLMAAFDGLAVYPLNAIPLGEGLMATVYGQDRHIKAQNWKLHIAYRLLASVPQGIGAFFVKDLSVLSKYAGIFTLLSYTTCPALLYLQSGKKMEERKLPTSTFYAHAGLSRPITAYVLVMISALIVLCVLLDATGLVPK